MDGIKIVLCVALAIVSADIDTGHCCAGDQPIIHIDKTYKCWDINKNTTSLLLLPGCCANDAIPLSAKWYNFRLNDATQLVIVYNPNHVVKHNSDRYCVGRFAPFHNTSAAYTLAIVCNTKKSNKNNTREIYAYFTKFCEILLISTIAYIALQELRDDRWRKITRFCF